jgi:thymidylate kinase
LAKALSARFFDTPIHNSPSRENSLSFLRDITKRSKDLGAFSRQLLHSHSNLWDISHVLKNSTYPYDVVIYDRSHLSTLVYGEADGCTQDELRILRQLHRHATGDLEDTLDVAIVLLDRGSPFGDPDSSYHEQSISWNRIRELYLQWFNEDDKFLFSSMETRHLVQVNDKTPQQVYSEVLEALGEEPAG